MKNGKVFGKINIIDFLVIVVLGVVIAGMGYRVFSTRANEAKDLQKFEFVVKVDGVRDVTLNALNKKGKVYASKNNIETGEIINVESEPFKQSTISFEGERTFLEVPDRYTVYVTIAAEGTVVNGDHFDADKTAIDSGRGYLVSSRYVSTQGEIMSVADVK